MRILLTGSEGYIGTAVKSILKRLNVNVEYCDLVLGSDFTNLPISFLRTIDGVIHLAAYTSIPESEVNPEKYDRNNFAKSLNFWVKYIIARQNKESFFLFASTSAVYDEDGNINPLSVYAKSKESFEMILKNKKVKNIDISNIRIIIDRIANPIGLTKEHLSSWKPVKRPSESNVPFILAECKLNNKTFQIHNDPQMIRDFISIESLANTIVDQIFQKEEGIFYLGSGIAQNVVKTLKNTCEKFDIKYEFVTPPPGIGKGYVPEIHSPLKKTIKKANIDERLPEYIEFMSKIKV